MIDSDKENRPRRLLIVEEGLRDIGGHLFSWVKAIRRINVEAGVEVLVAANRQLPEALAQEIGARRFFAHTSWDNHYHHPNAIVRYIGVVLHNWRVFWGCEKLLRKTGWVDGVFVPAARIHHLIGWLLLKRLYLGRRFGRLVIFIVSNEAVYAEGSDVPQFKPSSALVKHVLRLFGRDAQGGTFTFATDSHLTAREYNILAGVCLKVFPSPGYVGFNVGARSAGDNARVTFTTLGAASWEKGLDIFQDAILRLRRERPDLPVHFVVHWSRPVQAPGGASLEPSGELARDPAVTVLRSALSEDDYQRYLLEADCVVLAYRREVYFNRLSGVLVEAALAGIPVICSEGTWLEWGLREFGHGLVFREGDAADLCRAMITFCESADTHRQLAAERSAVARDYNSVERYMACLWNMPLGLAP